MSTSQTELQSSSRIQFQDPVPEKPVPEAGSQKEPGPDPIQYNIGSMIHKPFPTRQNAHVMQLPGSPTLLRLKATTRWNTLKLAYDAIHQANSPVVESPPLPPRAARKHDRQGRLRVGDLINYGTIARLLEPNNFNAAIENNTLDHLKLQVEYIFDSEDCSKEGERNDRVCCPARALTLFPIV
jgi:hypothetical protein